MVCKEEGILSYAFLACTEPLLIKKKWFRTRAEDLAGKWIETAGNSNNNGKSICTAAEAVFRLDQAIGPIVLKEYSADAASWLLAHLPNDTRGFAAVKRLITLILCEASTSIASGRAQHWLDAIREFSEQKWTEYPLGRVKSVLYQTLYLGLSHGVISVQRAYEPDQLYDIAKGLLDFFCGHKVVVNVEEPIKKASQEVATPSDVLSPQLKGDFNRLLHELDNLMSLLETISSLGRHVHHSLLPGSSIVDKKAIGYVCQFQNAVLDALTSNEPRAVVRTLGYRWENCKPLIVDFVRWLFPNLSECIEASRNAWMDKIPWPGWPGKIILLREKDKRKLLGFLPRQFVENFAIFCLDNVKKWAYPDKDTWPESDVRITLAKEDNRISVEVTDAGQPFEPESDDWLQNSTLGDIEKDIEPFGAKIIFPERGKSPKSFRLSMLSVEWSPPSNQRKTVF